MYSALQWEVAQARALATSSKMQFIANRRVTRQDKGFKNKFQTEEKGLQT